LIGSDVATGDTLLYHLDFDGLLNSACNDTDYGNTFPWTLLINKETWNLTDFNGSKCVLGQQNSYLRRKRTSRCLANIATAAVSSSSCECTVQDFTCDYCFSHVTINSTSCSLSCGVDPALPPANCASSYAKTQGYYNYFSHLLKKSRYRLVPGTKCNVTTNSRLPVSTACPANTGNKSSFRYLKYQECHLNLNIQTKDVVTKSSLQ
jgi:hypothetical protein